MKIIRTVKLKELSDSEIERLEKRGILEIEEYVNVVNEIINNVKEKGDKALLEYTEKFDKAKLTDLKVSDEEIKEAYEKISPSVKQAIITAKENIEKYHRAQMRDFWTTETTEGVFVGQLLRPIEKVGCYIPGGRAVYPSSVMMTTIPAKIAGVKTKILCTPPREDGKLNHAVLVAANEVGVEGIYKVGGAQAIAAMAFGTESVPKVDKIIGPGNIYVISAKMVLSNIVAVDLPAGPSEILIIADESADPRFCAVDLVSQAEHDPMTVTMLITPSESLANKVKENLNIEIEKLSTTKEDAKESLANQGMIIITENMEEAIDLNNKIAPEHLEIITENPMEILSKITNAGSVFLGNYSPVTLGDYAAGSNHVLPTGGFAKTYSGLSIYDYVKIVDVINCTRTGLLNLKDTVVDLAREEGLEGHAQSILKRFEK